MLAWICLNTFWHFCSQSANACRFSDNALYTFTFYLLTYLPQMAQTSCWSTVISTVCHMNMISSRFPGYILTTIQCFQISKYNHFSAVLAEIYPARLLTPKIIPIQYCLMLSTGDPLHICWTPFKYKNGRSC